MKAISVIIPSYKPKDYVYQCLNSLLEQTLDVSKFEVLLILNGCKEPYYSDLVNYIKDNNAERFIRLIQTDTPGVSHARNFGLDISTSEYIAFVDDDDFVSSTYLEKLLSKASKDTIAISNEMRYNDVTDSFSKESFSIEYDKKSPKGKQPYSGTRKFFSGPCMKLLHRDVIASYRFDTQYTNGEDSLFMFAISAKMKYVDFTSPDAVYYRRVRSGSAMSKERGPQAMIKNRVKMIGSFIRIYLTSPKDYSFRFLWSRILGCFHSIYNSLKGLFRGH